MRNQRPCSGTACMLDRGPWLLKWRRQTRVPGGPVSSIVQLSLVRSSWHVSHAARLVPSSAFLSRSRVTCAKARTVPCTRVPKYLHVVCASTGTSERTVSRRNGFSLLTRFGSACRKKQPYLRAAAIRFRQQPTIRSIPGRAQSAAAGRITAARRQVDGIPSSLRR